MFLTRSLPALRWARAIAAGALGLAATVANADSISPTSYAADLGVGNSVTVRKTVTVTSAPTTAVVDVVFLFDITGSMGGAIAGAKSSAANILNSLSSLGSVQSSTGWYADPTFDGTKSPMTGTNAVTIAAINSLGAVQQRLRIRQQPLRRGYTGKDVRWHRRRDEQHRLARRL